MITTAGAPVSRPVQRLGWLGLGVAALGAAIATVAEGLAPWWVPVAAGVAPDLSFLAALGAPFGEHGRLAPRAVPAYNLVHRLTGPVVLLAAAAGELTPGWTVTAALGWLAHIAIDRASGYGLRTRDGWQRG